MATQRKASLLQCPSHDFVDGVVPADILPQADELTRGCEEASRMQPTADGKTTLGFQANVGLTQHSHDVEGGVVSSKWPPPSSLG